MGKLWWAMLNPSMFLFLLESYLRDLLQLLQFALQSFYSEYFSLIAKATFKPTTLSKVSDGPGHISSLISLQTCLGCKVDSPSLI